MAKLKLKVAKTKRYNPHTRAMGYAARVITNGKADFEDIVAEACHNTTIHKVEAKMTLELCMESVAAMLKQGYIVDLGPVGRLYPSCTSAWVTSEDALQLSDVHPSLYFRPAADVQQAVKGATLAWAKVSDDDEDLAPEPTDTPDSGDNGGDIGE